MNTINGLTKAQAIEKVYKIAFEGEGLRQACSQATLNAVSEVLGIKSDLLFRVSSALEGGGACTAKVACGAWSGAMMILSYFFGRTYEQWLRSEKNLKSSFLGQKIYEKFVNEWGSAICPEIHNKIYGRKFDFSNKEDFDTFEKMGGHSIGCTVVCAKVSTWVVDILWDEIPKDLDLSMIPGPNDEVSIDLDLEKLTGRKGAGWGFEKIQ